jgi:hypothetical protein
VQLAPVVVATRDGPVEISPAARDELVAEIRSRDDADEVAHALATGARSGPVEFDRAGKIVVFDAVWSVADRAGDEDQLHPELSRLRERLKDEIAEGPAAS